MADLFLKLMLRSEFLFFTLQDERHQVLTTNVFIDQVKLFLLFLYAMHSICTPSAFFFGLIYLTCPYIRQIIHLYTPQNIYFLVNKTYSQG